MVRRLAIACGAAGCILVTSAARADDTPPASTTETAMRISSLADEEAWLRSQQHESWYGWQLLAIDASAVAILLIGASVDRSSVPFAAASLGVYSLGPSVVHVAHGSVWRGLASIGLRVGLPTAGYGLGRALENGTSDGRIFGALVGGAGAIATDASVLGWDRWRGAAMTASF